LTAKLGLDARVSEQVVSLGADYVKHRAELDAKRRGETYDASWKAQKALDEKLAKDLSALSNDKRVPDALADLLPASVRPAKPASASTD
jgi:hypothetical protein